MGADPELPQLPIDSIKVPELPKPTSRVRKLTELEEEFYKAHTVGLQQDIAERKKYAHLIYWLTVAWLIGLAVIVLLHGWRTFTYFDISERIILALITSATIEVVGLFVIVAKYLFPSAIGRGRR
jgi:phosphoglycerol transferase MdoB-like AlkP superfamily enzyme